MFDTRISLLIFLCILLISLFAPFIAPYDPMDSIAQALQPAGAPYVLGTDLLGRDVWSRLLYGGRHTLTVAVGAVMVAVFPGLFIGICAAVSGYWVDQILMFFIKSVLSIPSLMVALVVVALLSQGSWQLVLATGGSQIAAYAWVARSAVMSVRQAEFIEGAKAIGAGRTRIIMWYLLPAASPTLIAYAGVVFGYCMINSAALSFLGLGGDLGVPDWGVMMAEGRMGLRLTPWGAVVPGLLIFLTVSSVNTIMDNLILYHRK